MRLKSTCGTNRLSSPRDMASSGRIRMRKIEKMLDKCAPGHSIEQKKHNQWVRYNGKTYHLPQGEHGKRNPEIEQGHVKQMVHHLDIDVACAQKHLKIQISEHSANP